MPNAFSKEITVAFDELCEEFEDGLVLSKSITTYNIPEQSAERTNDVMWRPVPYIALSRDGEDSTGNDQDITQLTVPCGFGYRKHVPWEFTEQQLRDPSQLERFKRAGRQRLASDINQAVLDVVSNQGTLVVTNSGAATGYDDLAECDSVMNEQGIPMEDRYAALSSRTYNSMAGNLAARQTMNSKPTKAYEKTYVGEVAGFDTRKMDTSKNIVAAAATGVTINGANQFYTPVATAAAATGEAINVDNRYQTISITVTSGTVKVGDAFTIAGVNAEHHITKEDTGQLKTFRIHEIVTGAGGTGTVKISPPIISGQGATDAELQYKNVTATPADGAALTFLNTTTAKANPFWHYDSIEFLPSVVNPDTEGSADKLSFVTENGLGLTMTKQFDNRTYKTNYRIDMRFGICNKNPEMNGIMLFNQV